jgi:hypothetical protein
MGTVQYKAGAQYDPATGKVNYNGTINTPNGPINYQGQAKYDDDGAYVPGPKGGVNVSGKVEGPGMGGPIKFNNQIKGVPLPVPAPGIKAVQQFKQEKKAELENFKDQKQEDKQEFQANKKQGNQEVKAAAQAIKGDSSLTPEQREAALKDLRDKFEADRKAREDQFKKEREAARVAFEAQRKTARAELATKLSVVKDERKKELAAQTGDQFNQANAKITAEMTANVGKIEAVLGTISAGADAKATAGVDVSAVRADIDAAKSLIAAAREAITAQTAKTYTVTISTEANLKTDFSAVRTQLAADLKAVQDKVVAAREATRKAGGDLARLSAPAAETNETSDQ